MNNALNSVLQYLLSLFLSLPGLLLAMVVHEYAHARVSSWLGDPTPLASGRLSLNPFRHLDPVGMIMLILLRFGWAKPVMIDPSYYRNRRLGVALTSLAGPLTNLITAFVLSLGYVGAGMLYYAVEETASGFVLVTISVLTTVIVDAEMINVGLALFNLIPVPPLDGSKVLMSLLPRRAGEWMVRNERWSYLLLILLMFDVHVRVLNILHVPTAVTYWLSIGTYLEWLRDLITDGFLQFWLLLFG